MRATTLSIVEGTPAAWPQVNDDDDPAEAGSFTPAAWQRIEAYVAYRWGERTVEFIAEGPGDWIAPLQPFSATTTEQWLDDEWTAVTLAPSAFGGFVLDGPGPYRLAGNLGTADDPPEAVREAVWRFVQFMQAVNDMPVDERVSIRQSVDLGGLRVERERSTAWIAKALQQSGAADLLRPWRNLGGR